MYRYENQVAGTIVALWIARPLPGSHSSVLLRSIAMQTLSLSIRGRRSQRSPTWPSPQHRQHATSSVPCFGQESTQARARSALRRTLSSLRSAAGPDVLEADRETVRLNRDHLVVDASTFEELAAKTALVDLEEAAGLYRGDLLAGFSVRGSPEFEDWHRTEAERFRRLADDVLARLVHLVAATGNNVSAVELAERRVALDPLNESARRMVMLAEAWAGRRSGAIARYRDAVRVLESELGVPPLPETTELYERIRKGERPDQPGPPARTAHDRRSGDQAAKSSGPMVGREADLAAVLDGYRAAAYSGRLVVIEGEAGIGKTRLVTEALSEATAAGGRVAFARCHEGERDLPYAPLAELLKDLLDLGPGIFFSLRVAVGVRWKLSYRRPGPGHLNPGRQVPEKALRRGSVSSRRCELPSSRFVEKAGRRLSRSTTFTSPIRPPPNLSHISQDEYRGFRSLWF